MLSLGLFFALFLIALCLLSDALEELVAGVVPRVPLHGRQVHMVFILAHVDSESTFLGLRVCDSSLQPITTLLLYDNLPQLVAFGQQFGDAQQEVRHALAVGDDAFELHLLLY